MVAKAIKVIKANKVTISPSGSNTANGFPTDLPTSDHLLKKEKNVILFWKYKTFH